jgi:hypothetical protein
MKTLRLSDNYSGGQATIAKRRWIRLIKRFRAELLLLVDFFGDHNAQGDDDYQHQELFHNEARP